MSRKPDKFGRSVPPPVPSVSSISEEEDGIAAPEPLPAVNLQDPRIGETLAGRYRLDRLVGKGGMGRVYKGTQFPLNRPVAVKILNPEFQKKDPQFVRRFFLEAASAARLSHPNTITVFDYGESERGELFIVMELLKGLPLSKVIASDAPLSAERTLYIGMQICRALREAHTKGIIHRDLKPGNILLLEEGDDADFVKVLDFGLVKLFTPPGNVVDHMPEDPVTPPPIETELTKAGMFLGSPKYMSPEQIQGTPLDPRTDIYSLGVLMFQMATGKPPFTGATSVEVIYKHVNEPVPTFASHGVQVPPELEAMIHQMLAKHRDDRFESMATLLARMKDVSRLITGVSAASMTGIDIDPSEVGALIKRPRGTIPPTGTVSIRPRVHGAKSSERPSVLPVPPLASGPPTREAAFAETHGTDDTGSGAVLKKRKAQSVNRLVTAAPVVAGAAFVVMLGVLAYVVAMPKPNGANSQAPVPEAADPELAPPKLTRVHLESEPSGAEVFDRGVNLGTTPLQVQLPAAGIPHEFLFKKDGFQDVVETRQIAGNEVSVRAKLATAKRATPPPPPPARGPEEDYKENPY